MPYTCTHSGRLYVFTQTGLDHLAALLDRTACAGLLDI